MKLTKKQIALIDEIEKELEIDLTYELLQPEHDGLPSDIDAFMELIQERINEIEVIYYHNAMEYLTENDPSLQYSLGIASDMGYEIKNLNSELLATLLKQHNLSEEMWHFRDKIEELFYSDSEIV